MSEHDSQVAFFQWIDLNLLEHPIYRLTYAVPNGGHRHISVASKLKKEGVRAGVWDVSVDYPCGDFIGLKMEFKHGKNKLTEQQKVWRVRYEDAGYKTVVVYNWEDAVKEFKLYKKGGNGKENKGQN